MMQKTNILEKFKKIMTMKITVNKKTAIIVGIAVAMLLAIAVVFWLNLLSKPASTLTPTSAPTATGTAGPTSKATAAATSNSKQTPAPTVKPNKYTNKYVSEEAIDMAKALLKKNEVDKLFLNYQVGTTITEDTKSLYAFGTDEVAFINSIFNSPSVEVVSVVKLVDIDNDGQEEIAVYKHSGKDDNVMTFAILEKDPSGTFLFCEFPGNMGQFEKLSTNAFVKIGEKVFFVTATTDMTSGTIKDLNIYAANSGTIVERAIVTKKSVKIWTDGVNAKFVHATSYVAKK